MRKTESMPPAQAAVPLRRSFPLPIGGVARYLVWQVDLEWRRRVLPLFLGICPRVIRGFFGT
jgi:hypothetical protein